MGAPVTWFESSSTDSEAPREFYGGAFDWTFQVPEGFPYAVVDSGVEGAIAGHARPPVPPRLWHGGGTHESESRRGRGGDDGRW
jgi:predicted enzyme related to lactoylglutathione lyase